MGMFHPLPGAAAVQRAAEGGPGPSPASLPLGRMETIKSDLLYCLTFVVSVSLNSRTSKNFSVLSDFIIK